MKPTVSLISDEFPEGRYKLIHSVGGAASVKIDWNAAASKYTGLFREANLGLIRLASATQPSEGKDNKVSGRRGGGSLQDVPRCLAPPPR